MRYPYGSKINIIENLNKKSIIHYTNKIIGQIFKTA